MPCMMHCLCLRCATLCLKNPWQPLWPSGRRGRKAGKAPQPASAPAAERVEEELRRQRMKRDFEKAQFLDSDLDLAPVRPLLSWRFLHNMAQLRTCIYTVEGGPASPGSVYSQLHLNRSLPISHFIQWQFCAPNWAGFPVKLVTLLV